MSDRIWRATRRTAILGLGTLSLAAAGLTRVLAQDAASSSDKVFLDYTQAELDDAYDQRVWAANAEEVIGRYRSESGAVLENTPPETFPYGAAARETLDVYRPGGASGAPIHVHFHGGAWRALSSKAAAFLAPYVIADGAVYVAVDFDVIPDVDLPEMMAQSRRAIRWVRANADRIGGDASRIVVSGHSSGAHAAGVLLTTDWLQHDLPADMLKAGLLLSGIYDMEPVLLSSRSDYVKLSDAEADNLSAQRHLDRLNAPVVIVYGSGESPEFQRQSRDFAAAIAQAGKTQMLVRMQGVNHFEIPFAAMAEGALPRRATTMLMQG